MKKTKRTPEQIEKARAAKRELAKISGMIKASIIGISVNEALVMLYKEQTGKEDFRTFAEWKKDGKFVKKGEKGFPVWSKPITVCKNKEAQKEAAQTGETVLENSIDLYAVCYLFHEGQVS